MSSTTTTTSPAIEMWTSPHTLSAATPGAASPGKQKKIQIACSTGKVYEVTLYLSKADKEALHAIKQAWQDVLEQLDPQFSRRGDTFTIGQNAGKWEATITTPADPSAPSPKRTTDIPLKQKEQEKIENLFALHTTSNAIARETVRTKIKDLTLETMSTHKLQLLGIAPPQVYNRRNDCFLIAAIHALRAARPRILKDVKQAIKKAKEGDDAKRLQALQILQHVLLEFKRAQEKGGIVRDIHSLRKAIKLLSPSTYMDEDGQHDAAEILGVLLGALEDSVPELTIEAKTTRTIGDKQSEPKQETFFTLDIPLFCKNKGNPQFSFDTSIEQYFNRDFKMHPSEDGSPDSGIKRETVQLDKAPPYLVINLKRSQYDQRKKKVVKLTESVNGIATDKPLDLKQYIGDGSTSCEYDLVGVVMHHGENTTGGHYTAIIQQKDELGTPVYYRANDESVTPLLDKEAQELAEKEGYTLIYRRRPQPPASDAS